MEDRYQGPVVYVNCRKPGVGRWVKSIYKKFEEFKEIEVCAVGSAISLAIYAVKTVENDDNCKILGIESDLIKGRFNTNPSMKFYLGRSSAWGAKRKN